MPPTRVTDPVVWPSDRLRQLKIRSTKHGSAEQHVPTNYRRSPSTVRVFLKLDFDQYLDLRHSHLTTPRFPGGGVHMVAEMHLSRNFWNPTGQAWLE